ncbi:GDSL esterase/lipase At5g03610 isoform X1 [Physcomitrium patens]|uniref:GDSL esterase/lipase At5g03610 isoform X1 n=1 Tax=Physcomitrium patens TaxID=3218 RepID=UPI003CCD7AF5
MNSANFNACYCGRVADLLGLPLYPPPYLYTAGENISYGVNFAVGGSGVFKVLSNVSLDVQVDNFELFLRTDPYSKAALENSVTYVSVGGNDYLAFRGTTEAERLLYIERVIRGIQANLQRLYDLGLRHVMVANIPQPDCLPLFTEKNNWTNCTGETGPLINIHNSFLLVAVENINARNPGARFIILDHYSAFSRLLSEADEQGFTDGLKPCCTGTTNTTKCGDVDASGKWLYTVCKHRGRALFWDSEHPTMWAWHYIIDLYTKQPNYILLAGVPTLRDWLQNNNAAPEPTAALMSQPGSDLLSVAGQVQTALNCLLDKPNYSEALGVLQSFSLEAVLAENLGEDVTVFIPSNDAFAATDQAFIDGVFSMNKVNDVAAYHVANGYFDYNTIATVRPSFVISVTGEQLPIYYPLKGVFVGLGSQAEVVDPDLCVMPDEMVIHGIDHILMPHNF